MPPSLTVECGKPTPNGPCTMKKGHYAPYCRHRKYEEVTWTIETLTGVTLETGSARVPMNYAISRAFKAGHNQITIHLKQWNAEGTENGT